MRASAFRASHHSVREVRIMGAAQSTRSEMMRSDFSVIIEQDSDGTYVASVPSLRGCHTQGNSLDQVMERIREAIALCVEEQGGDTETLDFVGIQKVSIGS